MSESLRKQLSSLKKASALSKETERIKRSCIRFMEAAYKEAIKEDQAFEAVRRIYNEQLTAARERSVSVKDELDRLFDFAARAYEDGNEMLILVTEMTVNPHTSRFIARHGCDRYMKYKEELMITERNASMKEEIAQLLDM